VCVCVYTHLKPNLHSLKANMTQIVVLAIVQKNVLIISKSHKK